MKSVHHSSILVENRWNEEYGPSAGSGRLPEARVTSREPSQPGGFDLSLGAGSISLDQHESSCELENHELVFAEFD
jgi:hypothetical protein